jgi:hypothetical protein
VTSVQSAGGINAQNVVGCVFGQFKLDVVVLPFRGVLERVRGDARLLLVDFGDAELRAFFLFPYRAMQVAPQSAAFEQTVCQCPPQRDEIPIVKSF